MDTGLIRVLLDPGHFFEARMQDEPSLKVPALIALVIGITGAITGAISANAMIAAFPGDMQALGSIGVAFAVVGGVIRGFFTWIAVGIVFHIVSMLFVGEGTLKRTLEFTGYGFLPQVFGGIIGAIFSYQIFSNLPIMTASRPEDIAVVIESLTDAVLADPLTKIIGIVSILFLIWSANIWIFGMRYARNLSTRNAALTVGIPVGFYILYMLITLAGWL